MLSNEDKHIIASTSTFLNSDSVFQALTGQDRPCNI